MLCLLVGAGLIPTYVSLSSEKELPPDDINFGLPGTWLPPQILWGRAIPCEAQSGVAILLNWIVIIESLLL